MRSVLASMTPIGPAAGYGRELVGVEDRVAVALLGEEALAVLREVLVDGVARDERVEVGRQARLLRAQQAAEALGLLLARAERPGHLDGDGRLGQVDREVRDLADRRAPCVVPSRNSWYSRSRSSTGVAPVSFGRVERVRELVDLVEVLADDEDALARVPLDQLPHDVELRRRGRGEAVALVVGRRRVARAARTAGRSMRTS